MIALTGLQGPWFCVRVLGFQEGEAVHLLDLHLDYSGNLNSPGFSICSPVRLWNADLAPSRILASSRLTEDWPDDIISPTNPTPGPIPHPYRLRVVCQSEKWVRAAEEPTISHFWPLQVTSHKQWHFMGRGSSSFLPGFLSIVLPDLANSMRLAPPSFLLLLLLLHPSIPITHSYPCRPPFLLNQTARLLKTEEGKEKGEMINDDKATRGSCGSGTYQVDKQAPLTCRWLVVVVVVVGCEGIEMYCLAPTVQ
ncbi:uncharacterized protein LOC125008323 [Mugil cephalus]|uniref:uncharacterized protein LOC125008323 n=1 Tax=Mugil cephalus TaxID=48193 RepID=UPI001FB84410|nr:uncharacterized protein LOC125008323 [Mugil cephalus]